MPVMNGSDLCRALRDDPATAAMPTLMITARGHNLPPAEMEGNHICRMMGKPFSTAELLAHVRDLLPTAA
jgi:DNA-binding response OmpR family regulator